MISELGLLGACDQGLREVSRPGRAVRVSLTVATGGDEGSSMPGLTVEVVIACWRRQGDWKEGQNRCLLAGVGVLVVARWERG